MMIGNITTGTGKRITTEYRMETDGGDLLIVFEFKCDLAIAWDVDQITLRHSSGASEIVTGRGNDLPEDGFIGAQLLVLATPLLKQGLFNVLNEAEQKQVSDFALNAFVKLSDCGLQELSTYELIQSYKDFDYTVSFKKHPKSSANEMEWQIVNVERTSL